LLRMCGPVFEIETTRDFTAEENVLKIIVFCRLFQKELYHSMH
jgi:hypothetical protein